MPWIQYWDNEGAEVNVRNLNLFSSKISRWFSYKKSMDHLKISFGPLIQFINIGKIRCQWNKHKDWYLHLQRLSKFARTYVTVITQAALWLALVIGICTCFRESVEKLRKISHLLTESTCVRIPEKLFWLTG